MATRKNRKQKADPRLRARVRVGLNPDGSPLYKWVAATNPKELERKKAEIIQRYITGIDSSTTTLGDYLTKQWLPGRLIGLAPSTQNKIISTCNAVVLPAFGSRFICSVTKAELLELLTNEQSKGRSHSHLNNVVMVVKEVFAAAQAEGVIKINPAHGIKPPTSSAKPHHKRALTAAETAATLEVIRTSPHGLLLSVLYHLGLRRGEALGLRWEDIDFTAHCVHVQRDIDFAAGTSNLVGDVKTQTSNRAVPMPEAAENALRAARGIGWVFSRPDGQPYHAGDFRRAWDAIQKGLASADPSIDQQDGKSTLTPHYFRHNYATLLHRAGVPVEQARDWLGHSSIAVTMDIYTHLDQAESNAAATKLATVFG